MQWKVTLLNMPLEGSRRQLVIGATSCTVKFQFNALKKLLQSRNGKCYLIYDEFRNLLIVFLPIKYFIISKFKKRY